VTRPGRPRLGAAKLAVSLVWVGLLLVPVAACSSGDGDATRPPEPPPSSEAAAPSRTGGRVVYGLARETEGWNPGTSPWSPSGREVARALFDTLAAYDVDLEVRPDLAEAITSDATSTVWTIRLRPGVVLHDGRPVDARLVADGLDALRAAPQTATVLEPVAEVAPTDALTVAVTMRRPWTTFPHVLTGRAGMVADPAWLRSGDGDGPVGTGPFRLGSWEPGHRLVAARHPDYWRVDAAGGRLPYLDEVEFRPIVDPEVREAALRAGSIDLMLTTSSAQLEDLATSAEAGELQLFTDPTVEPAETAIALEVAVGPFDDPEARRALALATDAAAYTDAVEGGRFEPASGPFPEGSPWTADTGYPAPDADGAVELVERVKARNGGTFAFAVTVPIDPHALSGVQYLVDRWAAVGITATIEPLPPDEVDRRLTLGAFQAAFVEGFDGVHPVEDAARWHPRAVAPVGLPGLNVTRFDDPRIGTALDEAEQATDPETQRRRYGDAQAALNEGIPYVWLVHGQAGVGAVEGVVDAVTWSLPDGTPGRPLVGGTHPLWQTWRPT
jgi:peptide/nickel transport system substrate-binding protein